MLAYLLDKLGNREAGPAPGPGAARGARPLPDLGRIKDILDDQPQKPWSLRDLERISGYTRFHLLRTFRESFHETPHRYLQRRRIDKAKRLLVETSLTVTDICFEVGFESLGSFSTRFREIVGWPPSVYRARSLAQRTRPLDFIPSCHVERYRLRRE